MELLSDLVTWGEKYLHHFPETVMNSSCGPRAAGAATHRETEGTHTLNTPAGHYLCARCLHPLYHSRDKWVGPCRWASFRSPALPGAASLRLIPVGGYNKYSCQVFEVHCGKCDLFIGHQFEDGKEKGDSHPAARWRH